MMSHLKQRGKSSWKPCSLNPGATDTKLRGETGCCWTILVAAGHIPCLDASHSSGKNGSKPCCFENNSLQCYYLQPRTKRLFSLKKNNIKKKHSQAIFFSACSPTNTSTCSPFFSSFKQVYICGGFNGNECLSTAEVYDATTDQWTFISPMRSRRSGVGVIAYGKQVYAVR